MIRLAHAMVLAAGFGTRMMPLTADRPKPLIPVAGRPLIDHALDHAQAAGIGEAVVNLHYRGAMLRAHLAGRTAPRIAFSEEAEILDTGGGIARALPLLGHAPFAVLNADAIWAGPNPLALLANAWKPELLGLLLLVARERTRGYDRAGDFFLDPGQDRPRRRGTAHSAPFVYTGAQILAPEALADAPAGSFSLNRVWDGLRAGGRLGALVYPGLWADVGTPAGIVLAEQALREAAGLRP